MAQSDPPAESLPSPSRQLLQDLASAGRGRMSYSAPEFFYPGRLPVSAPSSHPLSPSLRAALCERAALIWRPRSPYTASAVEAPRYTAGVGSTPTEDTQGDRPEVGLSAG